MVRTCYVFVSAICISLMISGASVARANSVFNFDNDTSGQSAPFTDTVGGLSATFTGPAAVCDISGLGFVTLSANALIQDYCVSGALGSLSIAFSSNLPGITLDFATAGGPATITLQAFENGVLVGTSTFSSSVPFFGFNGEGFASFTGQFNSLTISSFDLLAIDNVDAGAVVPEPGPLATSGLGVALLFSLIRRRHVRHA